MPRSFFASFEDDVAQGDNDGFNYPDTSIIDDGEIDNDTPEGPMLEETAVLLVDECCKEGAEIIEAEAALESMLVTLKNIRSTTGRMSSCEALVLGGLTSSLVTAGVESNESFSLESFGKLATGYTATEVSFEWVLDAMERGLSKLGLLIRKLVVGLFALIRSGTPIISKRLKRAQALMAKINGSHRESGLKELSGSYVGPLSVEGRVADPGTVIKTLNVMSELRSQILADGTGNALVNTVSTAMRDLVSDDAFNKPNFITRFMYVMFAGGVIGEVIAESVMEKMLKGVTLQGTGFPQFSKLVPAATRIREQGGKATGVDLIATRSAPLFGGKVVTLRDVDLNKKYEGGELGRSLSQVGFKLESQRGLDSEAEGSMKTLTSDEQRKVLGMVIEQLTAGQQFFKNFGKKLDAENRGYIKILESLQKTYPALENDGGVRQLVDRLVNKIYWQHFTRIRRFQCDYIFYMSRKSVSLMDYVQASQSANNADS